MFSFGEKKEKKKPAVEETTYSVLIHFTPRKEYVYLLEDDEFTSDTAAYYTDKEDNPIEIHGDFVFINDLNSKREAEIFVEKYSLENPIWFSI